MILGRMGSEMGVVVRGLPPPSLSHLSYDEGLSMIPK